jgi:hypothetical protein
MSKLKTLRIFLEDEFGDYYRICSVANPRDYKGEYYLKIMLPDIKGIPLITVENDKDGVVGKVNRLPKGLQEFTYHYRAGVSHFKDSHGRVDQEADKTTLFDFPALHLMRFVVRTLTPFAAVDSSKVSSDDFVFPKHFDGKPRGFEFVVSRIAMGTVTNEQGKEPIYSYGVPLTDPNVCLWISDSVWMRPSTTTETLFEIFRYSDPTGNFSKI